MANKIDWNVKNQVEKNLGHVLMKGEVETLTEAQIETYNQLMLDMLDKSNAVMAIVKSAQSNMHRKFEKSYNDLG